MSRLPPVPPRPKVGPPSTLPPVPLPPGGPIPTVAMWKLASANLRQGPTPALVQLLDPIDDSIEKYNQAFSPMAKRNMAKAVSDGVAAWIKKAKQISPIMTIPLVLTTLQGNAMKAEGPAARSGAYSKVACVGWAVKTGAFDQSTYVSAWDEQNKQWEQVELVEYGGLAKEEEDLAARINAMKQAIQKAHGVYNLHFGGQPDDKRTLKVFMAPEFFFRGKSGAYSIDKVSDILPELRKESSLPKYTNWLFVFGTAIGATVTTESVCRRCGKASKDHVPDPKRAGKYKCSNPACGSGTIRERALGATIDNVALIQKGGEADDENAYTVQKEFVSHIDFRRLTTRHANGAKIVNDWSSDRKIELDTGSGMKGVTALPPPGSRDKHSAAASKFTDERMGGGMFTIAGISIGMEICLDHYANRLASQKVQVQLVPSAGADLQRFGCVDGGIAFNVDGLGPHADARVNDGKGPKSAMIPPSFSAPFTPNGVTNVPAGKMVAYAPVPLAPLV